MSFGKGVTAPKINFLKEVLPPEGAIFYESNEPYGLQHALHEALREDLCLMGEQNRAKVRCFDWDEIGLNTFQVYKKCMAR